MILAAHIQGIPCRVRVTRYFHQPAMGYWADSPDDCYGYTEVEFEVLDGRGRRAPWLERRMLSEDRNVIEQEIIAAKERERQDAEIQSFSEWGAYA
ncbi:hypothetical protein [Castellaniella sp. S9]|uniref:hypothetical protein n=1 Tax=Castellaniella sp. S9 TaxID=2993652 RepID=UPI0022B3F8B2|nr:hypothetical protein [Castellaniella sp. S9]